LATFKELFGTNLIGLGLIGDFNIDLEAKLSVEAELSLEVESLFLIGLNISLVGKSFGFAGEIGGFAADIEVVLGLTVGDDGVFVFTACDKGIFTIGDIGVFMIGDDGFFTEGDDGVFPTVNRSVLGTGDFGIKFLETVDVVTLSFKVVVLDTIEVDFIDE